MKNTALMPSFFRGDYNCLGLLFAVAYKFFVMLFLTCRLTSTTGRKLIYNLLRLIIHYYIKWIYNFFVAICRESFYSSGNVYE